MINSAERLRNVGADNIQLRVLEKYLPQNSRSLVEIDLPLKRQCWQCVKTGPKTEMSSFLTKASNSLGNS